jgi:hypothetical protein
MPSNRAVVASQLLRCVPMRVSVAGADPGIGVRNLPPHLVVGASACAFTESWVESKPCSETPPGIGGLCLDSEMRRARTWRALRISAGLSRLSGWCCHPGPCLVRTRFALAGADPGVKGLRRVPKRTSGRNGRISLRESEQTAGDWTPLLCADRLSGKVAPRYHSNHHAFTLFSETPSPSKQAAIIFRSDCPFITSRQRST